MALEVALKVQQQQHSWETLAEIRIFWHLDLPAQSETLRVEPDTIETSLSTDADQIGLDQQSGPVPGL